MTATGARPVLVTIPISHYCEKARWALDRAGIDYEERAHLPVLHRVAVRRAGGGQTVPVLVCPDGVLRESADIVAYADARAPAGRHMLPADAALAAQAQDLAAHFDRDLGPHTRRWVYHGLRGQRAIAAAYLPTGVPAWQRRSLVLTYRPMGAFINHFLDITPQTAAASERKMRAVFDEVGERLGDGRRYLMGDHFTTADLTFAALAAPLIAPPEYGVPLPTVEELPSPMAATVRELREHPAGVHGLAMFRDERR